MKLFWVTFGPPFPRPLPGLFGLCCVLLGVFSPVNRRQMDTFGRDRPRGDDEMNARRDRSRSRDRNDGVSGDGTRGLQKEQMSKAAIEDARRERLAMVKRLTGDTNEEPPPGSTASETAIEDDEDEDAEMRRILGIDGFGSSKGKVVEDNHDGAARGTVSKHKARQYRQYMNRKGGFNRPLDKLE